MLREGQILFTYLHLAPDPEQTKDLLASRRHLHRLRDRDRRARGGLPLLAPMSEVAGRMSPQVGAWTLQKANGGRGVLLGGVPGVAPAQGGGARRRRRRHRTRRGWRSGMGADVTVLDRSLPRLRVSRRRRSGGRVKHRLLLDRRPSSELMAEADLVIGAVLVPGAAAPKLVTREQLKTMKPGAVLVDVAIDQGGCFETSQRHHPRRPDLRGRRRRALLRGQHAGRRGRAPRPSR